MKMKMVTLSMIAGLATSAMAEDFSLSIVGPTTVEQGSVFTIEITGDSTFGTHIMYGAYSLVSNNSIIDSIAWIPADWDLWRDDGGYAGNGNYNEVVAWQFFLGAPGPSGPGPESFLGEVIGSFQITVGSGCNDCVIDFTLVEGSDLTLQTADWPSLQYMQDTDGTLTLNGLSVNVVPTTSSAVMLGLGGLVATRRRRA